MNTRNFWGYLEDILVYCEKIQRYTSGFAQDDFLGDELRQLSIIRCLEVIGEAAKHIPNDFKMLYPEVAWKTIAGMRDYLIHDYMGVNSQLVWKTAINDVPDLAARIKKKPE